jgi:hypothetical protein
MGFRTFSDAKNFVHSRIQKSQREWKEFCRSGKKPEDIPYNPDQHYKDRGWISWGDWLGTDRIATYNKQYRPFNEPREYVRSLNYQVIKNGENIVYKVKT